MPTNEDKINVELIKTSMSEKKITLFSLKNKDWKKVNVDTVKLNKFIPNIPTGNITELNELIYAEAELV